METSKMNEQELNKKLAEWAGFKDTGHRWLNPDGGKCITEPSFTHSLDACFKWLWKELEPTVESLNLSVNIAPSGDVFWNCCIKEEYQVASTNETPAMAFCLAIEKLIDSQASSMDIKTMPRRYGKHRREEPILD
jgi:hypothetical protein